MKGVKERSMKKIQKCLAVIGILIGTVGVFFYSLQDDCCGMINSMYSSMACGFWMLSMKEG